MLKVTTSKGVTNLKSNYLGIATIAVIGYAIGSMLRKDMSAETIRVPQKSLVTSLAFQDIAVANMTMRQNVNTELNHLYGGVPNPTAINIIKMITGTPSFEEYNPGVTL
jgi:hypothetical protein|tara:strand:- start:197 stop:523 length:327 start_codon:yes stop_codon:yes gene_type:complete